MPFIRQIFIALFIIAGMGCKSPQSEGPPSGELQSAPRGRTFTEWGDYLIDSSDLVSVAVQNRPDLSGVFRVSPSGYLSLPVIGMVRARGLTEMQLKDSVYLKLRPYYNAARIGVTVTQINSYVVFISGKVTKPGPYRLEARTTLLQGLAIAGGLRDEDASRVTIVRDTPQGIRRRFQAKFTQVQIGATLLDNFLLERGDLIIVE